ncbi:hypothetical protein HU200_006757 [Digitaria exilis]|uniref:Uncharacterized protein n=1 Tax=Digitaria exilis TaxID=1010633 RepID=A0A835KQD0_9POAL|nr:hypothetical protein HU200_006757 [Digitaria exilis]
MHNSVEEHPNSEQHIIPSSKHQNSEQRHIIPSRKHPNRQNFRVLATRQRGCMVSMGFLEPSTDSPHEFTVQESLWKACPRTFLPSPAPSGERGGTHRPQFSPRRHRLHSNHQKREREMAMAIERGRDYERGCGRGG